MVNAAYRMERFRPAKPADEPAALARCRPKGNNRRLMSNTNPLMDLLFPGTRQRVLAVLLLQPEASFHLRELARLAGSHAGTLARELEKLTQAGLLLREDQGNQVRYRAQVRHPLFEDLAAIFRKTHGAVALLRDALAPLDSRIAAALVFGSVARGTASAASDVDLLVLGDVGFAELARALYPLHEALRREVNPVLYAPAEFAKRARSGDAFARELLAQPKLWVKGTEHDLAKLVGDQAPAGDRARAGADPEAAAGRPPKPGGRARGTGQRRQPV